MGTDDGLALGLVGQEVVDLGGGSVETTDGEAVVGDVQDQVLTHDGQTNQTEISRHSNMEGCFGITVTKVVSF